MRQWYVLQVRTGYEDDAVSCIRRKGIDAFAPREERTIRSGGEWRRKIYHLMPGYVFVRIDYSDVLYYVIRHVPGVLRVLQADGRPCPLPPDEAAYISYLGRSVLRPSSVIRMPDGSARVVDGILGDMADSIERVQWHRRRAVVRLTILGVPRTIELSIIPVSGAADAAAEAGQTAASPAG